MKKPYASLKAAAEDKDNEGVSKSVPTFALDPRTIKIKAGFNARPTYPEHVAYMQGLQDDGVDTGYLIVQQCDDGPYLIDGHHRLQAVMNRIAAGTDVKTVKVLEFKGDEKKAIFTMLATQSGRTYTPLQVGEKYKELENQYGMSYAEIAKERGMSVQHVKDCIRLTEQPVELKEIIASGVIAPATALKLVKSEGATAALATIKEAAVLAPKKGITQKVINNLAKNVVSDAVKRGTTAREHIAAMIDSPAFDGPTKAHLRETLAIIDGKQSRVAQPKVDAAGIIGGWLNEAKLSTHSGVQSSAFLLHDLLSKKPLPADGSPSAQAYGNMVWLQDMAATNSDTSKRAAAHWFLAVLRAKQNGGEVAPAPSVLPLEDAMRAEQESDGAVFAETLCPEQAALIAYFRCGK